MKSALMNFRIRWLLISLYSLVFIVHGSPTLAYDIPDQTLVYEVTYTSHGAGDLEIRIKREGDKVKTTAISHLSATAKMFLSGLTVETIFGIQGENLVVEAGNVLSHDNSSVESSFRIDYANGNIDYHPKEDIPIENGDVFESTSFPLVLLNSKMENVGGTHIREISAKKARYYVYHQPEKESINVNGVDYDTWRVTRHKRGEESRTVTFWLDRNNYKIPVLIESKKKNAVTTLVLKSID